MALRSLQASPPPAETPQPRALPRALTQLKTLGPANQRYGEELENGLRSGSHDFARLEAILIEDDYGALSSADLKALMAATDAVLGTGPLDDRGHYSLITRLRDLEDAAAARDVRDAIFGHQSPGTFRYDD